MQNNTKLREEVERWSIENGYPATDFEVMSCDCGSKGFFLASDDDQGAALIECSVCEAQYDILESCQYADNLVQNICSCGAEVLQVSVSKSFYEKSEDVRWVYVGAYCAKCQLSGVYVDWQVR